MPLYEYQCDACGKRFEVIQKFSDPAPEACRVCGQGPVQRMASSPAIQFKGSGFYITDYARKGGSTDGDGAKGSGAKKDGGKESSSESSAPSGDGGGESKKSEAAPAPAAAPATSTSTTPKT